MNALHPQGMGATTATAKLSRSRPNRLPGPMRQARRLQRAQPHSAELGQASTNPGDTALQAAENATGLKKGQCS